MMSHSRKAVGPFGLLMATVLGIIVLLVLIKITLSIKSTAEDSSDSARCQASVKAYAKFNTLPSIMSDAAHDSADIDCPTQFVTVDSARADAMRRQIADMMYDCWTNYGAGNLLLFDDSGDKFCMICDVFDFDDTEVQLKGMSSFLMSERVPKELTKGVKPTYFEYFTGDRPDPYALDVMNSRNTLWGTRKYAVMFTFYERGFVDGVFSVESDLANALGLNSAVKAFEFLDENGENFRTDVASFGGAIIFTKKVTDDYASHVLITPYTAPNIKILGCDELPVSMIEKRFRY
jgi:hypothetical protein